MTDPAQDEDTKPAARHAVKLSAPVEDAVKKYRRALELQQETDQARAELSAAIKAVPAAEEGAYYDAITKIRDELMPPAEAADERPGDAS